MVEEAENVLRGESCYHVPLCGPNTHLLSFLVRRRSIRLHVVKLRLHAVQPLVEVVVSAGEARGQLQGLLQRAEGLAAAGRHFSVARLDAVQLLLDQENLLACTEGVR